MSERTILKMTIDGQDGRSVTPDALSPSEVAVILCRFEELVVAAVGPAVMKGRKLFFASVETGSAVSTLSAEPEVAVAFDDATEFRQRTGQYRLSAARQAERRLASILKQKQWTARVCFRDGGSERALEIPVRPDDQTLTEEVPMRFFATMLTPRRIPAGRESVKVEVEVDGVRYEARCLARTDAEAIDWNPVNRRILCDGRAIVDRTTGTVRNYIIDSLVPRPSNAAALATMTAEVEQMRTQAPRVRWRDGEDRGWFESAGD